MQHSLVSIIIPVYNTESYLKECLDSVCNQEYKHIECICIDDGSTDSSLSILQQYASFDSRIKVLSQENKGPSASRNVGLDNAVGSFIVFLDSDDTLRLDTVRLCIESIEKYDDADAVMFNGVLMCNECIEGEFIHGFSLPTYSTVMTVKNNECIAAFQNVALLFANKTFIENARVMPGASICDI